MLFAAFWEAKANLAVDLGKPKEEVDAILLDGELRIAASESLRECREKINRRFESEPELGTGTAKNDPELTLADDEELELSIVFDPPAARTPTPPLLQNRTPTPPSVHHTPSPAEPNSIDSFEPESVDQFTMGANATFFRLIVSITYY